jgi:hypothetical protein
MERFIIEVPHEPEPIACARVVQTFLKTGSHWVTQAEWGCKDGNHKAWIMLESESKDEARLVVPVPFRRDARITQLNRFSIEEIDAILRAHPG